MSQLDRDPSSYVMHIDTTYKLGQVEYPLMVVGISDFMSPFHVVVFFIISQQTEHHFTEALAMLRRIYTAVTNKQLLVRYVMADADKAQRNAVDAVLGVGNELVNLMRYFHVATKIYKHTRGIPVTLAARISKDVADMHYAVSAADYERIKKRSLDD
ncbi:hypothetical protein PI124_g10395 [Phytophthora idaei]|nr:hypothetical protein PI125_g6374 [Phytophthora idaei]KAG3162340.1 hypothetical protein PI126_g5995 [Phytophthora idaei]KAG3244822.1 hypothetical protein PI124_g10395 [Phytophthora idaei]